MTRGTSLSKQGIVKALLLTNAVAVFLYLLRVIATQDFMYWFLLWNLLLAWLPLLFAWWLRQRLPKTRWLSYGNVFLTLLWLGFLPNSFYLVTDLIHLAATGEINVLYDAVMFLLFIFNGFVAGMASLVIIHHQLAKRWTARQAQIAVLAVIVSSSFAIYLGRSLRWNTWDVMVNPAGLLFDVSDRVVNPLAYPEAFLTTITFSALIGSVYVVVWEGVRFLRGSKRP